MATRLTLPLLQAMGSALRAALAGDGFDGGDFDGLNPAHFERAGDWVLQEIKRRRSCQKQNRNLTKLKPGDDPP